MHDETHTHHHGVCFDFHFNNLQAEDPLLSVRLSSVRDFSESPLFFGFSSVLNFFFISGVTPIRDYYTTWWTARETWDGLCKAFIGANDEKS